MVEYCSTVYTEGNAWFQLYFCGDGPGTIKLVERAKAAGYKALVFTVDMPEGGCRSELRHGFKMPFQIGPRQFTDFAMHQRWPLTSLAVGEPLMAKFAMDGFKFGGTESREKATFETLATLRDMWDGDLVVKAVLDVEDAVTLKAAGVDAIQVSSDGARQLGSAPSPVEMLPLIRNAVGPGYPLFFDSGLRSGGDVLKVLMGKFGLICVAKQPRLKARSQQLGEQNAEEICSTMTNSTTMGSCSGFNLSVFLKTPKCCLRHFASHQIGG